MNTKEALIQCIKERLPETAIGIRTDYSVDANGANRRGLSIERFGKRNHFILVSPYDKIRDRASQLLRENVGVSESCTHELLEAAHALTEINDLGSWALSPSPRDERLMSKLGIGGRGYKALPGAEELWLNLSSNLSKVERIDISEALDLTPGRSGGRKSYASFRDRSGEEVASIQLNLLSRQIRDLAFPPSEGDFKNADRRTGRWAHQVGADRGAFIASMIALLSVDNYFAPTSIKLNL